MADIDLERAESLRTIPMFADLDDVGLWHVSQLATEVQLPAGHVLVQPGEEGAGLFVVLDGTLIPIGRLAADRPFYSGKYKKHGMNAVHIAKAIHVLQAREIAG